MLRLMRDERVVELLSDMNIARASLAAHAYRRWEIGRRWFVILGG